MYENPIHRVAIVGTGVIGASWAALFLAHGLEVVATDPAPNAEVNLRQYIETAWTALVSLGLPPEASKEAQVHDQVARSSRGSRPGPGERAGEA